MTFDQFTHLLAVLAWPTVALIAGIAAVHCCRLLVEAVDSWIRSIERAAYHISGNISAIHGYWSTAYHERWQVEMELERDTVALADPHRHPRQATPELRREAVSKTAETALMTLLATNGGFPGSANDDAVRQIVREVRKLYEEVEKPTPEPVGAKEKLMAPNADADADDLTLDEVFGRPVPDLEEDMEEMEL